MKILHTSDWHLGKSLHDFTLLEDQTYFINWLLEQLRRERIDAVIIAGDVYDRPVPAAAAVALYDFFLSQAVGEMGIPVFAIAGNHDSASRLQFGSSLYQKSGYYVCGTPAAEATLVTLRDCHGPLHITLLPYLHIAQVRVLFPEEGIRTFDDAYRVLLKQYATAVDPGERNIIVAHGFFSNLQGAANEEPQITSDSEIGLGGMDIVDSVHFSAYDYAALGHLHAPQRCGPNARYSGSPLKYSLSEESQKKSVAIIDFQEKGKMDITHLPVPALRDVRTVRGCMDDLLEPSFHQCKQFDDYVFADIEGPECPFPMQKLRTLFPQLLGLRFVAQAEAMDLAAPQIQAVRQISRLSAEELFCRFFRECKGYDIPQEHLTVVQSALQMLEGQEEDLL